jgi:hypothetical protein
MAFPYKPVDFSEVFLRYSLALYFLSLQPHIMFPSLLSSLVFTVLALTAAAFWSPVAHYQHVKHVRGGGSDNHDSLSWLTSHTIKREKSASTDLVALHTSKCLSPSPTLQYQGINVTKVLPIYEVCSLPQAQNISCSMVLETITTTTCSTVLTGFFTKLTITDCKQNITFSSQSSYSLATVSATQTAVLASGSPSSYVQKIVSYYIAPWQSLAAGTPSDVAVLICKTDNIGRMSCKEILEVWVVHKVYVPVKSTSTISVSQSFASVSQIAKVLHSETD